MLNGVFDYKRFSKTPITNQPTSTAITSTTNVDTTGPSGPPGVIDFDASYGFQQGAQGHQGERGLDGPIQQFSGEPIDISLSPNLEFPDINTEIITDTNAEITTIITTNEITIGTQAAPFNSGYFNTGRFGLIDVSGNAMIPRSNGIFDIGMANNKFGNIYTKELHIISNTMQVLDSSGNIIKMSYDLDSQKISYDVLTDGGNTNFKIYSIENKKNTLDEKNLPYNGLSFYSLVEPLPNILDIITNDIFSDLVMDDRPEHRVTGIYIVINSDGILNRPTNIVVHNNHDGHNYNFEQTIDTSDDTIIVNNGDMFLITMFNDVTNELNYHIRWSQYQNEYPIQSITSNYFAKGAVTTQKITNSAITADKISVNSVSNRNLAISGITFADIVVNTLNGSKIAFVDETDFVPGTIQGTDISGTITTIYLNEITQFNETFFESLAVSANKLALKTIIANDIANDAISMQKLSPELREMLNLNKGPIGATGARGENGLFGRFGNTGSTGSTGQTGRTGQTGPTGPRGSDGAIGHTGLNHGTTGSTGYTGATGKLGDHGTTGTTGTTTPSTSSSRRAS